MISKTATPSNEHFRTKTNVREGIRSLYRVMMMMMTIIEQEAETQKIRAQEEEDRLARERQEQDVHRTWDQVHTAEGIKGRLSKPWKC